MMAYEEGVEKGLDNVVAKPGELIFNLELTKIYNWDTKQFDPIPNPVPDYISQALNKIYARKEEYDNLVKSRLKSYANELQELLEY